MVNVPGERHRRDIALGGVISKGGGGRATTIFALVIIKLRTGNDDLMNPYES